MLKLRTFRNPTLIYGGVPGIVPSGSVTHLPENKMAAFFDRSNEH
jgi:hypothetical protein